MVKGILNDYSSFTQEGIRSLKMIQRLKQAPIKIRINSLLIGSVTDDLAVVCVHDLFTDTYDFHYADQLNTLASVSEKYDFSLTEKKPVEQKEVTKKMSKYEFEQKQRKLTGLLIDKKTENQSTKQFFFKEEGILYIYNYKSRELKSKKEPDFMDEIERSLTLDDN